MGPGTRVAVRFRASTPSERSFRSPIVTPIDEGAGIGPSWGTCGATRPSIQEARRVSRSGRSRFSTGTVVGTTTKSESETDTEAAASDPAGSAGTTIGSVDGERRWLLRAAGVVAGSVSLTVAGDRTQAGRSPDAADAPGQVDGEGEPTARIDTRFVDGRYRLDATESAASSGVVAYRWDVAADGTVDASGPVAFVDPPDERLTVALEVESVTGATDRTTTILEPRAKSSAVPEKGLGWLLAVGPGVATVAGVAVAASRTGAIDAAVASDGGRTLVRGVALGWLAVVGVVALLGGLSLSGGVPLTGPTTTVTDAVVVATALAATVLGAAGVGVRRDGHRRARLLGGLSLVAGPAYLALVVDRFIDAAVVPRPVGVGVLVGVVAVVSPVAVAAYRLPDRSADGRMGRPAQPTPSDGAVGRSTEAEVDGAPAVVPEGSEPSPAPPASSGAGRDAEGSTTVTDAAGATQNGSGGRNPTATGGESGATEVNAAMSDHGSTDDGTTRRTDDDGEEDTSASELSWLDDDGDDAGHEDAGEEATSATDLDWLDDGVDGRGGGKTYTSPSATDVGRDDGNGGSRGGGTSEASERDGAVDRESRVDPWDILGSPTPAEMPSLTADRRARTTSTSESAAGEASAGADPAGGGRTEPASANGDGPADDTAAAGSEVEPDADERSATTETGTETEPATRPGTGAVESGAVPESAATVGDEYDDGDARTETTTEPEPTAEPAGDGDDGLEDLSEAAVQDEIDPDESDAGGAGEGTGETDETEEGPDEDRYGGADADGESATEFDTSTMSELATEDVDGGSDGDDSAPAASTEGEPATVEGASEASSESVVGDTDGDSAADETPDADVDEDARERLAAEDGADPDPAGAEPTATDTDGDDAVADDPDEDGVGSGPDEESESDVDEAQPDETPATATGETEAAVATSDRRWAGGPLPSSLHRAEPTAAAESHEATVEAVVRGVGGLDEARPIRDVDGVLVCAGEVGGDPVRLLTVTSEAGVDDGVFQRATNNWRSLGSDDGVVTVRESGTDPRPWIVTDRALPVEVPDRPRDRVELVRDVCSAVRQAGLYGTNHHTLRPGLVVETPYGTTQVDGWGVRGYLERDVGPSPYDAPEQLDPHASPDGETTVYRVGATAYELLTGQPPYDPDDESLSDAIGETTPTPPTEVDPELPDDVDFAIERAMQPDTERRYSSAHHMRLDLQLEE